MSAKKKATKAKTAKHCQCAAKVNELLAPQNGQLVCSYRMFQTGGPGRKRNDIYARVVIECQKFDSKVRTKPRTLVATFCPFCGVEYPEPEKATHQKGTSE